METHHLCKAWSDSKTAFSPTPAKAVSVSTSTARSAPLLKQQAIEPQTIATYESLSFDDLRDRCRAQNLSDCGPKIHLVARLIVHDAKVSTHFEKKALLLLRSETLGLAALLKAQGQELGPLYSLGLNHNTEHNFGLGVQGKEEKSKDDKRSWLVTKILQMEQLREVVKMLELATEEMEKQFSGFTALMATRLNHVDGGSVMPADLTKNIKSNEAKRLIRQFITPFEMSPGSLFDRFQSPPSLSSLETDGEFETDPKPSVKSVSLIPFSQNRDSNNSNGGKNGERNGSSSSDSRTTSGNTRNNETTTGMKKRKWSCINSFKSAGFVEEAVSSDDDNHNEDKDGSDHSNNEQDWEYSSSDAGFDDMIPARKIPQPRILSMATIPSLRIPVVVNGGKSNAGSRSTAVSYRTAAAACQTRVPSLLQTN